MKNPPTPQSLLANLPTQEKSFIDGLPPVDEWSPPSCVDIDMRIDRDGQWFYRGGRINRPRMVAMFSRILKREGDEYFLVTPVEKCRIQVDVAPFCILASHVDGENLWVQSNVGQEYCLSAKHPLFLQSFADDDTPLPLVILHRNLPALVNRHVIYEWLESPFCHWSDSLDEEGNRVYEAWVTSAGERFTLGRFIEQQ